MDDVITVRQIRAAIRAKQFSHANEFELHEGLHQILEGLGLTARREVALDPHNRIDLTTELPRPGGQPVRLGIEVKVAGNGNDVRRQLQRYAAAPGIDALLLVTTIYRHLIGVLSSAASSPTTAAAGGTRWRLDAKPFDVALINRGSL